MTAKLPIKKIKIIWDRFMECNSGYFSSLYKTMKNNLPDPDRDFGTTLSDFNAKIMFDTTTDSPYIEFNSEEDMSLFLTRWA